MLSNVIAISSILSESPFSKNDGKKGAHPKKALIIAKAINFLAIIIPDPFKKFGNYYFLALDGVT